MSTTDAVSNWYTGPTSRGVDYSPTWPTWVVGPGSTQTGDSDFANDAFQAFWDSAYQAAPAGDPSVPVNNGANYRGDLNTISSNGFNLVRLYNWDMARGTTATSGTGLDHINFLNQANSLGLKVVVPVSDYFLGDDQYAWNNQPLADYAFLSATSAIQTDFTQFIASITDPSSGKIHAAIHSISVGNEGDIGQGIAGTTPSNFLARTIWWIVNLHQQINGTGTGPDGSPVVNGATPIIPLSATFSNADQGFQLSSWFQCLINGASDGQSTPNTINGYTTFAANVTGLSATDPAYATYYYNSVNISQVSVAPPFGNNLATTMELYDSGASPWPGAKFNVPLLLMELFTPNRTQFPTPSDQATAAIGQVQSLESYLRANNAGTASSTTNLMGYNYFEFNDEQEVKLTGLYQYGSTSNNAQTGTTSVFYGSGSFPDYTFPVVSLTATPGPGGTGTLVGALQALFPTVNVARISYNISTGELFGPDPNSFVMLINLPLDPILVVSNVGKVTLEFSAFNPPNGMIVGPFLLSVLDPAKPPANSYVLLPNYSPPADIPGAIGWNSDPLSNSITLNFWTSGEPWARYFRLACYWEYPELAPNATWGCVVIDPKIYNDGI